MQRSRGFGHGVVVPRIVIIQWLCCQLCYMTAANQWTIVEIELLATVSWTCGCQPLSCRCSQNVMHCGKEICWTCLFRECMPFVKSKPPLPTRSLSFLRAAYVPPSLCIKSWLHHAHPFVAAAEKTCHMQRSRGFGHGVVVPRIVTIQWLCCQLWYETAANQRTGVEIELLATVSWTCGCQPLSYCCSQTVTHCRKEICWTCLFKESIPFVKSKPPLPTRSLSFLRAA